MGVEDGLNTLITMGVLLLAVGVFAGVLAGLLGVGGGIILVPAFFYVFHALGYPDFQLMQFVWPHRWRRSLSRQSDRSWRTIKRVRLIGKFYEVGHRELCSAQLLGFSSPHRCGLRHCR